ncbi:hypothetical protein GCM10027280_12820 [Micromonospora polyrhachis]
MKPAHQWNRPVDWATIVTAATASAATPTLTSHPTEVREVAGDMVRISEVTL